MPNMRVFMLFFRDFEAPDQSTGADIFFWALCPPPKGGICEKIGVFYVFYAGIWRLDVMRGGRGRILGFAAPHAVMALEMYGKTRSVFPALWSHTQKLVFRGYLYVFWAPGSPKGSGGLGRV